MIIIGSRVSLKSRNLIPNPCGLNFWWVHKRIFRNISSSIRENKYEIKFDNGSTKVLHSTSPWTKESISGILVLESIATVVEVLEEGISNENDEANIDPDNDKNEDIIFLMGGARNGYNDSSNNPLSEVNEEDNSMNDEVEINIGDINVPVNIPNKITNNSETTNNRDNNNIPLIYNQKLEAKRKEIYNLIETIITKTQNNLIMN